MVRDDELCAAWSAHMDEWLAGKCVLIAPADFVVQWYIARMADEVFQEIRGTP